MASAAYPDPIALPVRPATAARPAHAAHGGCWAAIGVALLAAPAILLATGMRIDPGDVAQPVAAIAVLVTVHFAYRRHRPGSALGDAAGVMGALFAALLLAGIVSHAGLRFRMPLIDGALFAADRAMGIDTASMVRAVARHPAAGRALALIYNSALPAMPLTALGLVIGRRADEAWTLCFGFSASIVLASLIAILIPAVGAIAYSGLDGMAGLPPGAGSYYLPAFHFFHDGRATTFGIGQMSGVVEFPSFHTVMALTVPYALRHHRAAFACAALWCALVIISTVPIGGHYGADLVAGAGLWATLIAVQRSIDGRPRHG